MIPPYLQGPQGLIVLCFCIPFISCEPVRKTYKGYSLFNIRLSNESQLEFLRELWSDNEKFEIDFWQTPGNLDESTEVLVGPNTKAVFEMELKKQGISYNVTNEDIQRAIEEEGPQRNIIVQRSNPYGNENYFNFSQFNTWSEIERYLRKLPEMFPDLVNLGIIGQTNESRDLIILKIGTTSSEDQKKKKKPAIWVDAGIHAREWISTASILYIMDSIINYYGGDETIQQYLDNIDWYFLPVLNPDGYAYSHAKDRMWRKNRSPPVCTKGRKCCQGVDLNRNFGMQWGMTGASKDPCSDVYHGAKPFSEPETKAVRDFIASVGNVKGYFTFHSYGQLWLHPFAYKKRTYPEDVEELRKLSVAAVENMRAVHGSRYQVGTAANILYPSSGSADDWAKAEANIKYVFSIELRPTTGKGNGFIVHPRNIIPTGEETWAGIRAVADKILQEFGILESKSTTVDYEKETSTENEKPTTIRSRTRSTTGPPENEVTSETEESEEELETEAPTKKIAEKTTRATTAVTTTTTTETTKTTTTTTTTSKPTTTTEAATTQQTSTSTTTTTTTAAAATTSPAPEPAEERTAKPSRRTTTVESEVETTSESGQGVEEPCYDLSTRCVQFEDTPERCENNAVKAICKKMCQQC